MGIRESLLNTITSVSNGDFIRVVTSAGASSKATLANVMKSFETGLGAKSSLTTSDYIRVVGSDNVSYKQLLSSVMDTTGMGETITTSGAWNATTAQTAFKNAYTSWDNNTVHVGLLKGGSVAAYIAYRADANYGAVQFVAYGNSTNAFVYTMVLYGGTWGELLQTPTRAEVNALNSNLGTEINNGTDLNTLVLPANDKKIKIYRGENLSQMTNKPSNVSNAWPFCLMLLPIGGAYTKQILHIYGTDAAPDYVYVRTQTYSAGSVVWTDWQQSPTRAEVDALNSNIGACSIKTFSNSSAGGTAEVPLPATGIIFVLSVYRTASTDVSQEGYGLIKYYGNNAYLTRVVGLSGFSVTMSSGNAVITMAPYTNVMLICCS